MAVHRYRAIALQHRMVGERRVERHLCRRRRGRQQAESHDHPPHYLLSISHFACSTVAITRCRSRRMSGEIAPIIPRMLGQMRRLSVGENEIIEQHAPCCRYCRPCRPSSSHCLGNA
jgi:hypothetical protein